MVMCVSHTCDIFLFVVENFLIMYSQNQFGLNYKAIGKVASLTCYRPIVMIWAGLR